MKRMRRILAWILNIVTVLSMTGAAKAESAEPSEEMEAVAAEQTKASEVASGMCGENVRWTLDTNGTLTLSGKGPTDEFFWNEPPTFFEEYHSQIKKVVVENGVTRIGSEVIDGLGNLKTVSFPASVTSVGDRNRSIKKAVVTIDPNNKDLKLVDGVLYGGTIIGTAQIAEEITIPDGMTVIPEDAFSGLTNLKRVRIPGTVALINEVAFAYTGLEAAYFYGEPPADGGAGSDVFAHTAENFTIYYRKHLAYVWEPLVGTYLFDTYYPMKPFDDGLTYPEGTRFCGDYVTWKLDANGTLTVSGKGLMWNFMYGKTPGWLADCSKVKKVVIEEGVTSVGKRAFSGNYEGDGACPNMTSVSIPASVTKLYDCFIGSKELAEIKVASGNKQYTVSRNALYTKDLKDLLRAIPKKTGKSFWVPSGTKTVGQMAFAGADALEQVVFPASLEQEYFDCLVETPSLTSVYYFGAPNSMTFDMERFYGTDSSLTVYYPAALASEWTSNGTVTSIGKAVLRPFGEIAFTAALDSRDVQFKGTTAYMIADGSAKKPRVTLKDAYGTAFDTGYANVSYRTNTDPGTAYADVQLVCGGPTASLMFKLYLPATQATSVANTKDGVKLTWNAVPGAKGYVIYRRAWNLTSAGWTTFERWNNTTATSWTDTKVFAGTRYQYGVKAYFAERKNADGTKIGGAMDNYNLGVVGPLKTAVRITTRVLDGVDAGKKSMTVRWTGSKVFTGYQIRYATDRDFTKNVVTCKITRADVYRETIKNLKSKTTYYVQVRSYHEFEGMTYFGEWSNTVSCKVK